MEQASGPTDLALTGAERAAADFISVILHSCGGDVRERKPAALFFAAG